MLDTGDASPLSTLQSRSKEITIVALANLAKFQGRYERFQELKKRYDLKWNHGDSTQYLERFFNEELTLDIMLQRIRQMIEKLPIPMGRIIKFGCLVGLRSSEIIESVRLINDKEAFAKYYDATAMTLFHVKFPEQFIRTTKKAFVSFITPDMLSIVKSLDNKEKVPSLNAIILACRRRHIPCDSRYCRKIHATYLHQQGIPVEIIDALQGRTPTSIFAKHYYKPSISYKDKVLDALEKLQQAIEERQ